MSPLGTWGDTKGGDPPNTETGEVPLRATAPSIVFILYIKLRG